MIGEEYEIQTSCLVLFTLLLLGPNILLFTLFLSTLELCTFVCVTDQVSHTYKTTKGKGGVVFFMPCRHIGLEEVQLYSFLT